MKSKWFDVIDPLGFRHRLVFDLVGGMWAPDFSSFTNIGHELDREKRLAVQRAVGFALMHGRPLPPGYAAEEAAK